MLNVCETFLFVSEDVEKLIVRQFDLIAPTQRTVAALRISNTKQALNTFAPNCQVERSTKNHISILRLFLHFVARPTNQPLHNLQSTEFYFLFYENVLKHKIKRTVNEKQH